MRSMILVALVCSVSGCASIGKNFNEANLAKLQHGVTTEAETIELLGSEPITRAYGEDGSYIAVWQYVQVVYVTTTHNKLIKLAFDKDRKFVRLVSTVNIAP